MDRAYKDNDWRQAIKREFEDIFFKEGGLLGVTGKKYTKLKEEKVTNVKERRYSQVLGLHF